MTDVIDRVVSTQARRLAPAPRSGDEGLETRTRRQELAEFLPHMQRRLWSNMPVGCLEVCQKTALIVWVVMVPACPVSMALTDTDKNPCRSWTVVAQNSNTLSDVL